MYMCDLAWEEGEDKGNARKKASMLEGRRENGDCNKIAKRNATESRKGMGPQVRHTAVSVQRRVYQQNTVRSQSLNRVQTLPFHPERRVWLPIHIKPVPTLILLLSSTPASMSCADVTLLTGNRGRGLHTTKAGKTLSRARYSTLGKSGAIQVLM